MAAILNRTVNLIATAKVSRKSILRYFENAEIPTPRGWNAKIPTPCGWNFSFSLKAARMADIVNRRETPAPVGKYFVLISHFRKS